MKIYVASSWRNDYYPDVVRGLQELGHKVFDFRNPNPGDQGFHWSKIDPAWEQWSVDEYTQGLRHPLAEDGFAKDFAAMQWAEVCVLVLPSGRSSHLEAGYFVGAGKPLLILVDRIRPELMYKMADSIHSGLGELLLRLQEIEDAGENGVAQCHEQE